MWFASQRLSIAHFILVAITGTTILVPYFKSSHCNSIKYWTRVDSIFKWIADWQGAGIIAPTMAAHRLGHALLQIFLRKLTLKSLRRSCEEFLYICCLGQWIRFMVSGKGGIANKSPLFQVMAWCQTGDKPFPDQWCCSSHTHILIAQCKTAVSPLLIHRRYCSLAQSHQYH